MILLAYDSSPSFTDWIVLLLYSLVENIGKGRCKMRTNKTEGLIAGCQWLEMTDIIIYSGGAEGNAESHLQLVQPQKQYDGTEYFARRRDHERWQVR